GGGFLVTNMIPRVEGDWMKAMGETMKSRARTGYVLRWRAGEGIDKLPGSETIMPNGIAISPDGKTVFIAETGGRRISKIDYASGRLLGESADLFPDNLTWAPDGRLIVTTLDAPDGGPCRRDMQDCINVFSVRAVEPDSLAMTRIYRQQGQPMGTAAVALVHGGYLFVTSVEVDRQTGAP